LFFPPILSCRALLWTLPLQAAPPHPAFVATMSPLDVQGLIFPYPNPPRCHVPPELRLRPPPFAPPMPLRPGISGGRPGLTRDSPLNRRVGRASATCHGSAAVGQPAGLNTPSQCQGSARREGGKTTGRRRTPMKCHSMRPWKSYSECPLARLPQPPRAHPGSRCEGGGNELSHPPGRMAREGVTIGVIGGKTADARTQVTVGLKV
jgi:hypothetical protein